jgi:cysteine desulfurase
MNPTYLDCNATSPLLPEVAEALDRAQRAGYANASSQHTPGRQARRLLEDARERIGEILGAHVAGHQPDRVLFTSGGTEANNLALLGLGGNRGAAPDPTLLISAVEHPSLRGPAAELARRGWDVQTVPVDSDGRIDLATAAAQLQPATRLVSVQLANSETGVIQPIGELATLCQARGMLLHTDAAQAVGRIDVDFSALGVAALSAAAHKFHGPLGIGLLIVRRGVELTPSLFGGFQQSALRPGTEPVALVLGLLAALEAWHRDRAARTARWHELREMFEGKLRTGYPDLVVHGASVARLPQTSNIAFVGVNRQALLMALDQAGIACSTGSACASGSSEPSPTLMAMNRPTAELESSLRFSFGALTTSADVADSAERILRVYRELRQAAERRKLGSPGRSPGATSV